MSDPTTREELVVETLRLLDLAKAMPVPAPAEGEGYESEGIEVLRGLPGMNTLLYPSQDGPGAGRAVEVVVHVMVGSDQSTVVVRRGGEPVVLPEGRLQGTKADGLGVSVKAAVREGLARLR